MTRKEQIARRAILEDWGWEQRNGRWYQGSDELGPLTMAQAFDCLDSECVQNVECDFYDDDEKFLAQILPPCRAPSYVDEGYEQAAVDFPTELAHEVALGLL